MPQEYEAAEGHDSAASLVAGRRVRHRGVMRGTWLALGVLVAVAAGCGDASSSSTASTLPPEPVPSPTVVPAADGIVTTTQQVLVSDDGSGPRMCSNGIMD